MATKNTVYIDFFYLRSSIFDNVFDCHLSGVSSDFIWNFRKLPFPSHLGKYFIKIGKISANIYEIRKIKAIFGLGMTPI